MQQWYRNTIISFGLAAALGGMAGCKEPYEKLDRFAAGKVVEENVYSFPVEPAKVALKIGEKTERTEDYGGADTGRAYVLKVEAQEMVWDETTRHRMFLWDETTGTQKMVPQTYTLMVRDSSPSATLPIALLDKQITVGTEVVFRTRDDHGNPIYPVSHSGVIDAQQLRVIRPYENPAAIKGGLEGEVQIEAQLQEKLEEKRRYAEAQKFYNNVGKKKE